MFTRTRRAMAAATIAGVGVGVGAVLGVAPATATGPQIVDPAGDATGFASQLVATPPTPATENDPAADILAGEVGVADGVLTVTVTLADLDRTPVERFAGRRYYFLVGTEAGSLTFDGDVAPGFEAHSVRYSSDNAEGTPDVPATFTVDEEADTVSWSVTLEDLNRVIDVVTEGRDEPIAAGSTLTPDNVQTYESLLLEHGKPFNRPDAQYLGLYPADYASGDESYEVPEEG